MRSASIRSRRWSAASGCSAPSGAAGPAALLLYGALLTHVALVVHKLYRRRSLRMPVWEVAPDRARPADPVLPGGAHHRHARAAPARRRRRRLRLRARRAVAGRRRPAEPAADHRLAARLHRPALLAAPQALVRAVRAAAAGARGAAADARADRLRQWRPGAAGARRGRSGLAAGEGRGRQLAGSADRGLGLRGRAPGADSASSQCCS